MQVAAALWLEVQKDILKGVSARVVDGAKQVITLSTVLAGGYFTASAFTTLGYVDGYWLRALYVSPVVLWFAALIAAVPAAIPIRQYPTNIGDPLSAKYVFYEMGVGRLNYLRAALVLQAAGIFLMLIVLLFRLSIRQPSIELQL